MLTFSLALALDAICLTLATICYLRTARIWKRVEETCVEIDRVRRDNVVLRQTLRALGYDVAIEWISETTVTVDCRSIARSGGEEPDAMPEVTH